ncbi:MAG TPA: GNAT family N-acetyltransferase [Candidatus Andersenbacteria bacterium]|nr:GNAT family N-acetyltransferase [Candidatus Andersenbacteria bacterium]
MIGELAHFLGLEMTFLVKPEQLIEHLFEKPIAHCLIAEMTESNAPVGYIVYYKTLSTFRGEPGLHLEDIFVREGFRNTGVGRSLLHTVCCAGKKLRCSRIQWEAPVENEKARQFYDSLDVPVVGGWVTYRITDALTEFSRSTMRYELGEGALD